MGIKGLQKYLHDKYPHLFKKINMYRFRQAKIAIDASGLAYAYWHPMQDRIIARMNNPIAELDVDQIVSLWFQNIWSFLGKLLRLGITPVMVFDGAPPAEKADVIKARSEERALAQQKIYEFREALRMKDPIQRTPDDLKKMKALHYPARFLNGDHFAMLKSFCNGIGIPVLQAKNEAEELCALLCREKLVSAVYCKDIDSLAHLAPCWIFGKTDEKEYVPERHENIECFEYVLIEEVLQTLGLSEETFVDLCIMCGCDYNVNIKNVGPANSYKHLKTHKSIDNLKISGIEVLNHKVCRERFAKRRYEDACERVDYKLEVDRKCYETYSKEYLERCQMDHILNELDFIYAAFPTENLRVDLSVPKIDFSKLDLSTLVIPPVQEMGPTRSVPPVQEMPSVPLGSPVPSIAQPVSSPATPVPSYNIDFQKIVIDLSNLKL